jgi:hypothetical protein
LHTYVFMQGRWSRALAPMAHGLAGLGRQWRPKLEEKGRQARSFGHLGQAARKPGGLGGDGGFRPIRFGEGESSFLLNALMACGPAGPGRP